MSDERAYIRDLVIAAIVAVAFGAYVAFRLASSTPAPIARCVQYDGEAHWACLQGAGYPQAASQGNDGGVTPP